MPRASIKANAKESLRGNWGTAILVLLLNWMLLSAATGVMVIGKLIIMGTLETGVALIYLKLSYREPAEIGDLFQPFQNFVNTFFAGFLSTIFTFLWSLLFVIPGIVKALAYSQVYYILCDHPEYTGREAIDASQEMMRGHKGELLWLVLAVLPDLWPAVALCQTLLSGCFDGVLPLFEGDARAAGLAAPAAGRGG